MASLSDMSDLDILNEDKTRARSIDKELEAAVEKDSDAESYVKSLGSDIAIDGSWPESAEEEKEDNDDKDHDHDKHPDTAASTAVDTDAATNPLHPCPTTAAADQVQAEEEKEKKEHAAAEAATEAWVDDIDTLAFRPVSQRQLATFSAHLTQLRETQDGLTALQTNVRAKEMFYFRDHDIRLTELSQRLTSLENRLTKLDAAHTSSASTLPAAHNLTATIAGMNLSLENLNHRIQPLEDAWIPDPADWDRLVQKVDALQMVHKAGVADRVAVAELKDLKPFVKQLWEKIKGIEKEREEEKKEERGKEERDGPTVYEKKMLRTLGEMDLHELEARLVAVEAKVAGAAPSEPYSGAWGSVDRVLEERIRSLEKFVRTSTTSVLDSHSSEKAAISANTVASSSSPSSFSAPPPYHSHTRTSPSAWSTVGTTVADNPCSFSKHIQPSSRHTTGQDSNHPKKVSCYAKVWCDDSPLWKTSYSMPMPNPAFPLLPHVPQPQPQQQELSTVKRKPLNPASLAFCPEPNHYLPPPPPPPPLPQSSVSAPKSVESSSSANDNNNDNNSSSSSETQKPEELADTKAPMIPTIPPPPPPPASTSSTSTANPTPPHHPTQDRHAYSATVPALPSLVDEPLPHASGANASSSTRYHKQMQVLWACEDDETEVREREKAKKAALEREGQKGKEEEKEVNVNTEAQEKEGKSEIESEKGKKKVTLRDEIEALRAKLEVQTKEREKEKASTSAPSDLSTKAEAECRAVYSTESKKKLEETEADSSRSARPIKRQEASEATEEKATPASPTTTTTKKAHKKKRARARNSLNTSPSTAAEAFLMAAEVQQTHMVELHELASSIEANLEIDADVRASITTLRIWIEELHDEIRRKYGPEWRMEMLAEDAEEKARRLFGSDRDGDT